MNWHLVRSALAASALALLSAPVVAHPMPDTEITVSRGPATINLVIRVPMHDLMLALPKHAPRKAPQLLAADQPDIRAYFARHLHVLDDAHRHVPLRIGTVSLHRDRDPDVGVYEELEIHAFGTATSAKRLNLAYDGVIHRVINHRALVRDRAGKVLGIIRYELATKRTKGLLLPPSP